MLSFLRFLGILVNVLVVDVYQLEQKVAFTSTPYQEFPFVIDQKLTEQIKSDKQRANASLNRIIRMEGNWV